MSINKENAICDTDNYKDKFDYTKCLEYNQYYVKLISHYLEYISEHTLIQNTNYYLFILNRGMYSLSHIFNILLLYTKNIDLTISHCNKALYYYIEFIGQISDDSHSYLQLNSKDASLFVYKKTIFEINSDFRKNFILNSEDKEFLDTLIHLNNISNEFIRLIFLKKEFKLHKREIITSFVIKKINNIMGKFKILTYKELVKKTPTYLFFLNLLQHSNIPIEKFLEIYGLIIKKYKKKSIKNKKIKNKIYNPLHNIYISNFTPGRYVNWLFTTS